MPPPSNTTTPEQTQTYYDDPSTNKFYTLLWGGQDIHIGIYPSKSSSTTSNDPNITTASHATITHMTTTLLSSPITLTPQTRLLDLGAGYGGSARHLAKTYGCHVTCLNLSRLQNARNNQLCAHEGVADHITVTEGTFEAVPQELGENFDVIWSQDSFLHSRNRALVVAEIDRLLTRRASGGRVVFTDIMATPDAFEKEPVLMKTMMERLHLEDLATVGFYKREFERRGFRDLGFWDGKEHFRTHYSRLGEELGRRREELVGEEGVEEAALERQMVGLGKWVEAADKGCVEWGVFCFGR